MAVFTVNGQKVEPTGNQKLLRFLRDELHLTSVKDGCSEGACGACTVIIDGKTCKACVPDTDLLDGRTVITVEGLTEWEREVYTYAYGKAVPEIAVATTKAYSTQLIAEYILALKFAHVRGQITDEELTSYIKDLKRLPQQIEMLLNNKTKIQRFANRYLAARDVFFVGRGLDYAISLEGSLKLKEISYIHSEAYAAGELKHGTISLIEEGTLVTAVLTQEELYKKTMSNMVEVKARGAFLLAVTNTDNVDVEKTADYVIYIPKTNKYFANSLAVIPLQLFAYYVSIGRGCDVDKPRNLAKSVTVE